MIRSVVRLKLVELEQINSQRIKLIKYSIRARGGISLGRRLKPAGMRAGPNQADMPRDSAAGTRWHARRGCNPCASARVFPRTARLSESERHIPKGARGVSAAVRRRNFDDSAFRILGHERGKLYGCLGGGLWGCDSKRQKFRRYRPRLKTEETTAPQTRHRQGDAAPMLRAWRSAKAECFEPIAAINCLLR
jgi:hypothetical protein